VTIQYWHVFAYNGLGAAGVGDHGGDWDATTGRPPPRGPVFQGWSHGEGRYTA
jgi:hypothetical protein